MDLLIFKTTWGMQGSRAEVLARIADAGYDGVELNPPRTKPEATALRKLLDKHKLHLVTIGPCPTVADTTDLLTWSARLNALKISVHGGRDSFTWDEGCSYFEAALEAATRLKVQAAHETHRTRILFTPWTTAAYLKRFPELRICADLSHWVTVCERLLDDRADDLELAIGRSIQTHARVGHEEGAQVSDPRAPEWANQVAVHIGWWKRIAAAHRARGEKVMTATIEWGPPNYMTTLPYTRQPVANLEDICTWMKDKLRAELS